MNAISLKKSILIALKNLSLRQVGYLTARDTLFLISTRLSEPLGGTIKKRCGDHPAVEHGANFISGFVGAILGHPFDTAFCRSQQKLPTTIKHWTLGLSTRSCTVGFLVVFYKAIYKEII